MHAANANLLSETARRVAIPAQTAHASLPHLERHMHHSPTSKEFPPPGTTYQREKERKRRREGGREGGREMKLESKGER